MKTRKPNHPQTEDQSKRTITTGHLQQHFPTTHPTPETNRPQTGKSGAFVVGKQKGKG